MKAVYKNPRIKAIELSSCESLFAGSVQEMKPSEVSEEPYQEVVDPNEQLSKPTFNIWDEWEESVADD